MITITRIRLRNYRGISALDVPIGGAGIIAEGRNGAGKSTVLAAIGAALAASDIGSDAVRVGEKDGEILVDLDAAGAALMVRRRFGESGSTVTVQTAEGDRKAKPTQLLADLLGSAPLDVIDVVMEKDKKKRKAAILKALPVTVTVEQLRRWVPKLPDTFDTSGHGLEVIERVRKTAYDKRTEANRLAKEASGEAARAAAGAKLLRDRVPAGAPAVEAASEELASAARWKLDLEARAGAAARAHASTSGLRDQAAKLRERSKQEEEKAVALASVPEELDEMHEAVRRYGACVEHLARELERLEAEIEAARGQLHAAEAKLHRELADGQASAEAERISVDLLRQAEELEAGIASAVEPVDEAALTAAVERHARANEAMEAAVAREKADKADATLAGFDNVAKVAQAEADRLDAVVRGLTDEAPSAILAATTGAPSALEIDGDDVRLSGVSLDHLCGAEQVVFAANIARALNPGVGFLVVDGLERLDPEQLDAFVQAATSDGRQLFGSRVDRGDLALVHLEHHKASDEAAE